MTSCCGFNAGDIDPLPLVTIVSIEGGAEVASTLTWKVVLAVALPSLTVIVIFALPDWLSKGVSVTVRLLSLPPNKILLVGISAGAEQVAHTVRLDAGVSRSLMLKGIAPVFVLVAIVCLGMAVMVGGSLTVTVNVRVTMLLLVPPSLTGTMTMAVPLALATGVKVKLPVALGLV